MEVLCPMQENHLALNIYGSDVLKEKTDEVVDSSPNATSSTPEEKENSSDDAPDVEDILAMLPKRRRFASPTKEGSASKLWKAIGLQ